VLYDDDGNVSARNPGQVRIEVLVDNGGTPSSAYPYRRAIVSPGSTVRRFDGSRRAMGDLWDDDGFGGGGAAPEVNAQDDWDEGEESLDPSIEDGFDDPDTLEDDAWDDDGD